MYDNHKKISLYDFINRFRSRENREVVFNSDDQENFEPNLSYKLSFNNIDATYLPDTLYLKNGENRLNIANISAIFVEEDNEVCGIYTIACSKGRYKITVY